MARVTNQYGTFETDKQIGGKRLPSNPQLESIAQKLYGKSFDDLTIEQRTKIRTGARGTMSITDTVTFEQYLDDYKNMAADPNYVPKYIKPNLGKGMSAQQKRARAEAKNTIENFEQKFLKNVNKRKRLKREADPIKKEKDLVAKAERRTKRRLEKKDVALTDREKKLNFNQRENARKYNAIIKKNPNLILNNKKLMDDLSITVSKDGDIIKIPTTLTEKYLKERGLFEIEHQRDIFKKGRGKDLPYNRNLIAGPYNRTGGFKEMAEKYIESNPDPDDPKVKKIIEKAKELKITIRPNVPKGTFPTVALGYKQLSDPIERILDIGEKTLDLKLDTSLDRPEKALTMERFKTAFQNYDNLNPLTYPSNTEVRSNLKKVPVNAPVDKAIKDFDIPKGTILKGLAKGTLRAVAPFVPFVGAMGVALGVSDVAKAKDQGLEGEELGVAYFVGPELAKKYADFKDRNLNVETESEGIMGLRNGGRVGFQGGGMDASEDDFGGFDSGQGAGAQFSGSGGDISPGTDLGGGFRGGDDDKPDEQPPNIEPPKKKGTIPFTVNLGTDNIAGLNIPKFVDFGLPTKYGLLNLRQRFSDFINPDEIDINPELTFGGSVPLFGGNLNYGVGITKEGLIDNPGAFITFSKILGGDKRR